MAESATKTDVIIVGAGAAGLMCAISAGRRGRRVLLIDHAEKAGKKILISGGGRCNFTNLHTAPDRFISANRHFCISALRRYTQHDFIALVRADMVMTRSAWSLAKRNRCHHTCADRASARSIAVRSIQALR